MSILGDHYKYIYSLALQGFNAHDIAYKCSMTLEESVQALDIIYSVLNIQTRSQLCH